jgi:lysophospholipid hydrolase
MTGASSVLSNADYMRGLDNEVEILYYAAGSTLAKAGEVNAGKSFTVSPQLHDPFGINPGLFYVIEGFLEILLPGEKKDNGSEHNKSPNPADSDVEPPNTRDEKSKSKLLFTVKPGGIAGYLGELIA